MWFSNTFKRYFEKCWTKPSKITPFKFIETHFNVRENKNYSVNILKFCFQNQCEWTFNKTNVREANEEKINDRTHTTMNKRKCERKILPVDSIRKINVEIWISVLPWFKVVCGHKFK